MVSRVERVLPVAIVAFICATLWLFSQVPNLRSQTFPGDFAFGQVCGNKGASTVTGCTPVNSGQLNFQVQVTTASTSITAGVNTKISFNNKVFDSGTYFDAVTNFRYTPLVAGKYFLNCSAQVNATYAANQALSIQIQKNSAATTGTLTTLSSVGTAAVTPVVEVSSIVVFNGSTDFVECFAQSGGTTPTIIGAATSNTAFGGFWISP